MKRVLIEKNSVRESVSKKSGEVFRSQKGVLIEDGSRAGTAFEFPLFDTQPLPEGEYVVGDEVYVRAEANGKFVNSRLAIDARKLMRAPVASKVQSA
ncbi:hypothetical protein [Xanthomonas sp. NCPPB 2632]|uniref:hypothetical protein n=1 Tax=Xanthomonas sp. NCPPB 2632 TaxID=3240912 RepID=UPI003514FEF6